MGKEGSGVTCLRRDLNKCPRALGSCGSAWRLGSACWDCTGLELEVASRSGAFPLPHPSSSTEGSGTQGGPLFRASCYPRPLIYLTSEPAFASPPRIARSHRGRDFRVPLWSGPFQSPLLCSPLWRLGAAAGTRRPARLRSPGELHTGEVRAIHKLHPERSSCQVFLAPRLETRSSENTNL